MFHRTWLRLLQLLGLRAKTTLIKRSSTFNPFGAFSITGVKRGSRWVWVRFLLLALMFGVLAVAFSQTGYPVQGWVCVGFEFISFFIAGWMYFGWASPECEECHYRTMHDYDCQYGRRFYRWEKQGMYLL